MLWLKALSPEYKPALGKKRLEVDGKILPGRIPPAEYDLSSPKTWGDCTGPHETKNWLDYLYLHDGAHPDLDKEGRKSNLASQPVFYHSYIEPALREIIKRKQETK